MVVRKTVSVAYIASLVAIMPLGVLGEFTNARLTYYNAGLGACGETNSDSEMIVAINAEQYGNGENCKKQISIVVGANSMDATIMDKCPGCPYGGLDLTPTLFGKLGSMDAGVLTGSWSFKDDSSSGGSSNSTGSATGSESQTSTTSASSPAGSSSQAESTTSAASTTATNPATTGSDTGSATGPTTGAATTSTAATSSVSGSTTSPILAPGAENSPSIAPGAENSPTLPAGVTDSSQLLSATTLAGSQSTSTAGAQCTCQS